MSDLFVVSETELKPGFFGKAGNSDKTKNVSSS